MDADFQRAVGFMIVNDRQWLERCCVNPGEYMTAEHIEHIKNSLGGVKMDIFGRIENGNVRIFHESGETVSKMTTDYPVYDINSGLGTGYEHPEGIVISIGDAKKLDIQLED